MKRVAVRNLRLCTKDCLCLYVCPTGATDTENSVIDTGKCLGCGDCYAEGLGVGVSDVFGGEDHDSSGYEFDVFSGVEHFCKVVDCCVRV
mgnify:CR=1 FL=1